MVFKMLRQERTPCRVGLFIIHLSTFAEIIIECIMKLGILNWSDRKPVPVAYCRMASARNICALRALFTIYNAFENRDPATQCE